MKFDTTWCPVCKNMHRFIGDIIKEQTEKDFYAIGAEEFQPIEEANEVRGIPSLLVFKNGEKIKRGGVFAKRITPSSFIIRFTRIIN